MAGFPTDPCLTVPPTEGSLTPAALWGGPLPSCQSTGKATWHATTVLMARCHSWFLAGIGETLQGTVPQLRRPISSCGDPHRGFSKMSPFSSFPWGMKPMIFSSSEK